MLVADKYQVPAIKEQAKKLVEYGINKENVVELLVVADQLNLMDVKQRALDYIMSKKAGSIDKLPAIDKLSVELWKEVARSLHSKFVIG